MTRKTLLGMLLVAVILMLCGCNMTTVDQLYCLPDRSEEHDNLQSLMSSAMEGLSYSAPVSGQNRQTVQMADLNGDGEDEYILFAKGTSENPLYIFIFVRDGEEYRLLDTIQSSGSAFDQVEYVPMDNRKGCELVIGHQVSDQVLRSVSVYTMRDDRMELLMSSGYSKFLCTDLSRNGKNELLLLRPGEEDGQHGIAELYSLLSGTAERYTEAVMSRPVDKIKRIMVGRLDDGIPAVYVASDVDGSAIITDVYAVVDGQFVNVSVSTESGTSVQTLRNYYVYADDIDNDGVLELPSLVTNHQGSADSAGTNHHVIRWYALQSNGRTVNKEYTYHNFAGGWYLELNDAIAEGMTVQQLGNTYEFYLWDAEGKKTEKIMSVVVLTGQKREEQALVDNRFIVYRGEATIYAAKLEVASAAYGIDRDILIRNFHLITQDWNTGET